MMTDKKIAVHVTNEEQWDEIREYYGNEFPYGHGLSYARNLFRNKELAQTSDSFWGTVACYHDSNEYELLEFSEWQARIKEDHMEKIEVPQAVIEVPQAVYDEFKKIPFDVVAPYSVIRRIAKHSDSFPYMREYLLGNDRIPEDRVNQFNLLKVMMGQAEFVPIEESYYWQDNQGMWLVKNVLRNKICLSSDKKAAGKLTETEIREKASFDIDKLKKVSD